MNSYRYMITRSCLENGIMRLFRYNEALFPKEGLTILQDIDGKEYRVLVNRQKMIVEGMDGFYTSHHLGVNDVLLFSHMDEREWGIPRLGIDCVIKPIALTRRGRNTAQSVPVPLPTAPHVRERRTSMPVPASRLQWKPPKPRPEVMLRAAEIDDILEAAFPTELFCPSTAQQTFSAVLGVLSDHAPLIDAAEMFTLLPECPPHEVKAALESLSHAPFCALTPLPAGQYILRHDILNVLDALAEYAREEAALLRSMLIAR